MKLIGVFCVGRFIIYFLICCHYYAQTFRKVFFVKMMVKYIKNPHKYIEIHPFLKVRDGLEGLHTQ